MCAPRATTVVVKFHPRDVNGGLIFSVITGNAPLVQPPAYLATNRYYGKMVTLPNAVFCLPLVCSAYGRLLSACAVWPPTCRCAYL